MQTTDSFLPFADLASAHNRAAQMAARMGCSTAAGATTLFWYEQIQLTDNTAVLVIRPGDDPYGSKPGPTALSQLTPGEIASLVPYSSIASKLPPPPYPPPGSS
jgi:hypothetical protein